LTYRSPIVGRFEKEFSHWVGEDSLSVSSGTAALHLALLSLKVGPGDEVILPAISFGTCASVVLAVGAKPVYVDTDEKGLLTVANVLNAVTDNTKAIISVHLYGEVAEDVTILGIPVIEDSCEALGVLNHHADFTCFSFFANKDMTTGEGGMLCGKDLSQAEAFRNGGFDKNYQFSVPGLNYRMTAMQAALGLAQLDVVDETKDLKQKVIEEYSKYLIGFGKWVFVANVDNPQAVKDKLAKYKIESRRVFPILPYQQAFRADGKFPMAERLYQTGLCLPTGRHVSMDDVKKISEIVNEHNVVQ